jgi:hypothetical protein
VYQCMTVSACKYMLVLAYLCIMLLPWFVEKCILLSLGVNTKNTKQNLPFLCKKIGYIFFETKILKPNNAKKGFWSKTKYSKGKWAIFDSFEAKKVFPFVSLWSANNLVEAKRKIGRKKQRKIELNFLNEQAKHVQNGSNLVYFAYKRKKNSSIAGAP